MCKNSRMSEIPGETRFFYDLTPEKVLRAVESYGFRCTGRVLALNSLENRVYEVEIEIPEAEVRSRYDRFKVAKFYRPGRWSQAQILEEHAFLGELFEKDLPVVVPLANKEGKTLQVIESSSGEPSGIYFNVSPKVGGRHLDELTDTQLEILGRTAARLHMCGASNSFKARRSLSVMDVRQDLEYLLSHKCLGERYGLPLKQVMEQILIVMDSWMQGLTMQRVHADLHLGNVLWNDNQLTLMDFDDSLLGPVVQDLWLILPSRDEDAARRREVFLSGYEQLRRFDRESLRLIEPLRASRMLRFSAWIARRWEDPIFPRMFLDFGSDRYWAEQLSALQESLQIMHGGQ